MFQPGELLVYGSTGVCQVLSIDQRQDYVNGVKQSRLYYQLKPLYQGGVIYTPVDNDKVVMRPVISRRPSGSTTGLDIWRRKREPSARP